MRTVLHIGQQRSGTTAIQNAFYDHAATLSERGVLYPRIKYAGVNPRRHHMLATVLDLATLPRGLRPRFGGRQSVPSEETVAAFNLFGRKVQKAVAAARPDVLVLSTEMLFRNLSAPAADRLRGWLERISSAVTVVVYVRKPSETFASNLWQALYARGVLDAGPVHFRSQLESWQRGFGDRLRVTAYDRATLYGGDVVADFAHRFVPEIGAGVPIASGETVNASSTAEIMAVLADVVSQAREAGSSDPRLSPSTLEPVLKGLAAQLGIATGKPRLHPQVADFLDHASKQVIWLRDQFGVTFPGIDYEAVGTSMKPDLPDHPKVSDLCQVNDQARAELARAFADWYARETARDGAA